MRRGNALRRSGDRGDSHDARRLISDVTRGSTDGDSAMGNLPEPIQWAITLVVFLIFPAAIILSTFRLLRWLIHYLSLGLAYVLLFPLQGLVRLFRGEEYPRGRN